MRIGKVRDKTVSSRPLLVALLSLYFLIVVLNLIDYSKPNILVNILVLVSDFVTSNFPHINEISEVRRDPEKVVIVLSFVILSFPIMVFYLLFGVSREDIIGAVMRGDLSNNRMLILSFVAMAFMGFIAFEGVNVEIDAFEVPDKRIERSLYPMLMFDLGYEFFIGFGIFIFAFLVAVFVKILWFRFLDMRGEL
jgi:hypothetical protein